MKSHHFYPVARTYVTSSTHCSLVSISSSLGFTICTSSSSNSPVGALSMSSSINCTSGLKQSQYITLYKALQFAHLLVQTPR